MENNSPDEQSTNVSQYAQYPHLRAAAYKKLYESPVVMLKIRQWANDYTLRDRAPEDVLQDAMILLDELLSAGAFRGDGSLTTYFLGICKNIIRAGARRVSRITFKEGISDADWKDPDLIADALVAQEEAAADAMRREMLVEKLQALTDRCREALQQYYFERLNMKQIALFRLEKKGTAATDVTEEQLEAEAKQAKKAVHQCRESLRKLF